MRLKTKVELSVQNILDSINTSLQHVSRNIAQNRGKFKFGSHYFDLTDLTFDVITNGYNLHSQENDHLPIKRTNIKDIIETEGINADGGKYKNEFSLEGARDYNDFVNNLDRYDPTVFQHKDDPGAVVVGTIFLSTDAKDKRRFGQGEAAKRKFVDKLHLISGKYIRDEERANDLYQRAREDLPDSLIKMDILHVNTDNYEFKPIEKRARLYDKSEFKFNSLGVRAWERDKFKFIIYVDRFKRVVKFNKVNKLELYLDQNKKEWGDAEVDIFKDGKLFKNDVTGFRGQIRPIEKKYKVKFEKSTLFNKDKEIARIKLDFTTP